METLYQSAKTRLEKEEAEDNSTIRNPLAPFDWAHPVMSGLQQETGGRGYKNKFTQGFLSGTGSTSQFQGVNQNVGIRRGFYNDNLEGVLRGSETLLPSWKRSYAFAPGLGFDALQSKVIWTPDSAGDSGPAIPNYGALNRTGRGGDNDVQANPIMPVDAGEDGQNKAQVANTAAPAILSGSGGTGLETFFKMAAANVESETKRRLAAQTTNARR